jgi:hypothetical protein
MHIKLIIKQFEDKNLDLNAASQVYDLSEAVEQFQK